jgi:hypothetical protein
MDVASKNLFRDRSDPMNSKPSSKIKVGQKGKTFHFKRENYIIVGQDNNLCRCLATSET